MSITTYAELKAAVADFLNREDLASAVPTFISLAEAQLARDVRHWKQEKRVETTLDEQYENLPDDYLQLVSLGLTDGTRLELISVAEMEARKQANLTAGKPAYFRISADQIEFYPAPSASYTLSMQYHARIPSLSDAAPDNWLLRDAPDAYLYGALLHSAPYLQDDARIQVWAALYQAAIDGLRADDQRGKHSGPLRMGVPR